MFKSSLIQNRRPINIIKRLPLRSLFPKSVIVNVRPLLHLPLDSDASYEDSESEDSVITDDEEIVDNIKLQIKASGLYDWLRDFAQHCETEVNTLVSRLASFIFWFIQKYKISSSPTLFYICLHSFLLEHTECLSSYCEHLTEMLFKASTVKNYIENILTSCRWFSKFRPNCKTTFVVPSGYFNIKYTYTCIVLIICMIADLEHMIYNVKVIRRIYTKKRRADFKYTTKEDFVAQKRWPPGGFAEIIAAVDAAVSATDLNSLNRDIDKKGYNNFVGTTTSSLYCGPQGRVAAIDSLCNDQVDELIAEGLTLSNILKTGSRYGYQPVIADMRSRNLLSILKNKVRPAQLNETGATRFFITQDGGNLDVGRSITRFFKRATGLHLTTTQFRSMMETMSAEHEEVNILFIYNLYFLTLYFYSLARHDNAGAA